MRQLCALVDKIAELPRDWHTAGAVSRKALAAIAYHAMGLGEIKHSVETGSGKTTLLFSHLSRHHLVFAMDMDNGSVSQVKQSPLFNASNVEYVEGPTQITLPQYNFLHTVQIALIDGPHGYPFPDLEYYYLYPVLQPRGLLLIDDIQIPSIGRMYDILKADDMFDLLEVVDNMAFFRRTDAQLINPLSDSWWLQGYNRAYYEEEYMSSRVGRSTTPSSPTVSRLLRLVAQSTPSTLKQLVPSRIRLSLRKRM